ncbi:uncharacterized protein LOC134842537 isoform X2 [Symsagittifera roscoffensis]|uniref:uncharacterized protein LOC134842537 isoform X2 n=1 Tax=Symsagittifera roscoffensis TaxID=84072 RepID=UPI00307BC758
MSSRKKARADNNDSDMKNKKVDTEVKEWAESKECSKSVCLKVATHVNKYQLRELKEWLKSDLASFLDFCRKEMELEGAELVDFSAALRDTTW